MALNNIVPSLRVFGPFEANEPFNRVVDPNISYSVEAIRTIPEMQGLNINIYQRVFAPLGIDETRAQELVNETIENKGSVLSLIPRTGAPVYVLTTYLKSWPLIDGWLYERMCLVVDFGSLAGDMKESLVEAQDHFKAWVSAHYGITPTVQLGTIPIAGYVSQDEHELMESARQNRITDSESDVVKNIRLEQTIVEKDAYIAELEARIIALQTP